MVLVDIFVPSVDNTFDFWLDENTEIEKIITEVSEMIHKKVNGIAETPSGEFMLYWLNNKCSLDKKRTLSNSGVTSGCKLMLI